MVVVAVVVVVVVQRRPVVSGGSLCCAVLCSDVLCCGGWSMGRSDGHERTTTTKLRKCACLTQDGRRVHKYVLMQT